VHMLIIRKNPCLKTLIYLDGVVNKWWVGNPTQKDIDIILKHQEFSSGVKAGASIR